MFRWRVHDERYMQTSTSDMITIFFCFHVMFCDNKKGRVFFNICYQLLQCTDH